VRARFGERHRAELLIEGPDSFKSIFTVPRGWPADIGSIMSYFEDPGQRASFLLMRANYCLDSLLGAEELYEKALSRFFELYVVEWRVGKLQLDWPIDVPTDWGEGDKLESHVVRQRFEHIFPRGEPFAPFERLSVADQLATLDQAAKHAKSRSLYFKGICVSLAHSFTLDASNTLMQPQEASFRDFLNAALHLHNSPRLDRLVNAICFAGTGQLWLELFKALTQGFVGGYPLPAHFTVSEGIEPGFASSPTISAPQSLADQT
jgi:hypothetical protein